MSEEVAGQLRSLAKHYSRGVLGFEEYRRRRTVLLDSLSADWRDTAAAVDSRATTPEAVNTAATAPKAINSEGTTPKATNSGGTAPKATNSGGTAPKAITSRANSQPRLSPGAAAPPRSLRRPLVWPLSWTSSRPLRAGALIAALLIASTVVWLVLRDAGSGGPQAGPSSADPSLSDHPARSDRIYALVAPLLDNPDWGDSRIAAVNASLLEEGAHQIAARQHTAWFQRFASEVRRRLKEQRALGAARLVPEESPLAALAVTIGLDPNAPDAPLRPPPHARD